MSSSTYSMLQEEYGEFAPSRAGQRMCLIILVPRKGTPLLRCLFACVLGNRCGLSIRRSPPLSLKYRTCRTFGILTASALARISGKETAICELCGSPNPGHTHTVLECAALAVVWDKPHYAPLASAPLCTKCTGIPSFASAQYTFTAGTLRYQTVLDTNALQMAVPHHRTYRILAYVPGLLYWPFHCNQVTSAQVVPPRDLFTIF